MLYMLYAIYKERFCVCSYRERCYIYYIYYIYIYNVNNIYNIYNIYIYMYVSICMYVYIYVCNRVSTRPRFDEISR